MPFVDRRRRGRYVVLEKILVVVEGEEALDTGTLINVGSDGCYVATPTTFRSCERVTLLVHVPEGKGYSMRFACMVAWCNAGQVATVQEGLGLEFLYDARTRRNAQKLLGVLKARNALVKLEP